MIAAIGLAGSLSHISALGCYMAVGLLAFFATVRRPIYGLLVLAFASPFDLSIATGPTTLSSAKVALIAVVCGLLVCKRMDVRRIATLPLVRAYAAIVLVTLTTVLVAANHGTVFRETAKGCMYLLTLTVAYCCYRSDPDERSLRIGMLCLTALVSVLALLQELTGAPSVFVTPHGLVARIAGPLEGPNQLAGFLDCLLAWLLVQTLAAPRRNLVALAVLCIGYCSLFLTFSRGGIAATLFTAAVLIAFRKPMRGSDALVCITAICAGLALDLWLTQGGAHLLGVSDGGDTGSLGHRSQLWQAAWFFFSHHPLLGIGAGNFEHSLAQAGYPQLHTHANSLYLQTLAESGALGFAALVMMMLVFARTFMPYWRSSNLAAGAVSAGLALYLHQIVDFLVFYPKVGIVSWILPGVALAAIARPQASEAEEPA